jgi:hypothetical protein
MFSVILKIEGVVHFYTVAVLLIMVVWFTDVSEEPFYHLGEVTTQRPALDVYSPTKRA